VAQIGAVIGREFSYRLLAVLSPLDETALQQALSQLIGSELAFRRGTIPDSIYSFKHAFVQEAAYRSLLKSRRQQLHAKVAKALGERFPELNESQPEILAYHLTEAGLTTEAIGCWQRAGQRAAERSANAEAAAHLHRGLDLLRTLPESTGRNAEELELLTALGSLLIFTKGYGHAEVATVYGRARDLCRLVGDTSHLAAVLQGLRIYHMYRADLTSAREAAEELLALGEGTGENDDLVEGQRAVGLVRFFAGEFQAARDHLERGIALSGIEIRGIHALPHVENPGAVCLYVLGRVLWMLGHPDQAVDRSEQAIAVAQASAQAASIAEAIIWRAEIAVLRREVQVARERITAALALATEYGVPVWTGMASITHGWVLSKQGHSADGVAQIREGLSVLARTGDQLFRPYSLARLAEALGKAGHVDEALSALDEAIDIAHRSAVPYWDAELQRCKGELLLDANDVNAAEACFRRAIDVARGQGAKSSELRAATSLARLLADQGQRRQAQDRLAPIYGWFTEGFDTADLKDAKALLDELCT
jgi:predicted ATPase